MASPETRVDNSAGDLEDFRAEQNSLLRRSVNNRWSRRMFRQPSSVIIIQNVGAQSAGADDAPADTSTPLLVSR